MPIRINELHIKATVADTQPAEQGTATETGQGTPPPDLDEIVALCVAQVLEILKDREER